MYKVRALLDWKFSVMFVKNSKKIYLDTRMGLKLMHFKWFQSIDTHPFVHKNFLKEKRQSGNFEPSTSDESRNKSLSKRLTSLQKFQSPMSQNHHKLIKTNKYDKFTTWR